MDNIAFIDGQNLHLGTTGQDGGGWKIDLTRFRRYLRDKYSVHDAYYFLGFVSESEQDLYTSIQKAGFILEFREHGAALKGKKKGNVDSDVVFAIMRNLLDAPNDFDKIILVSGDGDYKKIVDYLIRKDRFKKILFPNTQFRSSLYNSLGGEYMDFLDRHDLRNLLEYKKQKSP
jgi:uncharacterized LabA/DUF88 family protein